jgi:cell division protein FtsX
MKISLVIGAALAVLGLVLLYFGYNLTQSTVDQIYKAATGSHTVRTQRYLVGGAVALLGGGLLAVFGKK